MKVAPVMAAVEAWNARGRPATATGVHLEQSLLHTDQLMDLLFTTEPSAARNLAREATASSPSPAQQRRRRGAA